MKPLLKNLLMVAALSTVTVSAFADDAARAGAKQVIEMKDGSNLYVFKDGKMAMEDKYGRAVRMKKGAILETKDGQKITIDSDEVARLDGLLRDGHNGGH